MDRPFKVVASESLNNTASRVAGFYDRHGHWVRCIANAGVYATGSVLFATATTTVGKVAAGTVATVGFVATFASVAECMSKGFERGLKSAE